jgi:hypothetical protein
LRAQLETCYSTIQEISSVQLGLAQAQMHQMQNNVGGGTLPGSGGAYQPGIQSINKANNKPNVGKPKVSGPRPLSYQEKRQLGLDIRKLQPEMLDGVIQIIQESGAELHTDEDGDVEIDIDGLDTPALKKMQKYVKKNLNKMRQHM